MINYQIHLKMKKYLVETYYTCTFKTVHSLSELNEKAMADIDKRDDGIVEVIEVKLNNRKTKKVGEKNPKEVKPGGKSYKAILKLFDTGRDNTGGNGLKPDNKIVSIKPDGTTFNRSKSSSTD